MACLADPFDFESIKKESKLNDFRGVVPDNEDDGIDFDQVHAVESQMKDTLMQFQIDESVVASAEGLTPEEAEAQLKKAAKKAAKAKKLLKRVKADLKEETEHESWQMTAEEPTTGISMTDALVGKSLFDRKEDDDEEGEENLENGKIIVEKKEEKSMWEACCGFKEEKEEEDVEEEVIDLEDEEEEEKFDWAKERRKSKKKKAMRRSKSTVDAAPVPEEGKKKKKGVRRSKSTDNS